MPEQIETERLILRTPRQGDGVLVNAAIRESFPALNKWMLWARTIPSIAESETHIRESAARFRSREEISWLLFRKKDGMYVGSSSLHHIDWDVPRFEIGYWIRSSLEGKGYITEAVIGLTDFCFNELHATRMEIRCDSRNRRSAAVAERAGYTLEARLKWESRDTEGGLRDTLIYCKLRDTI
jgi:RimJ/RimL family protein N-acetyltransferase